MNAETAIDNASTATPADDADRMTNVLRRQRAAFMAELPVGAAVRKDRLRRAHDLIVSNKDRFARVLSNDFGQRSTTQTMLTDIMTTAKSLKSAIDKVDAWMKPQKRKLDFPLGLLGASARVEYQPKGVIGVIAPWNFPVHLAFAPLTQIFAAGNRAMVKPSELTPETSDLLHELVKTKFDETELVVIVGGADVAAAFAGLPFDHLIFTGSTGVGRHVLRAAAENLVPTTLELGGKSPVLIGASANIVRACERVITGKLLNAGQICLAPITSSCKRAESRRSLPASRPPSPPCTRRRSPTRTTPRSSTAVTASGSTRSSTTRGGRGPRSRS